MDVTKEIFSKGQFFVWNDPLIAHSAAQNHVTEAALYFLSAKVSRGNAKLSKVSRITCEVWCHVRLLWHILRGNVKRWKNKQTLAMSRDFYKFDGNMIYLVQCCLASDNKSKCSRSFSHFIQHLVGLDL